MSAPRPKSSRVARIAATSSVRLTRPSRSGIPSRRPRACSAPAVNGVVVVSARRSAPTVASRSGTASAWIAPRSRATVSSPSSEPAVASTVAQYRAHSSAVGTTVAPRPRIERASAVSRSRSSVPASPTSRRIATTSATVNGAVPGRAHRVSSTSRTRAGRSDGSASPSTSPANAYNPTAVNGLSPSSAATSARTCALTDGGRASTPSRSRSDSTVSAKSGSASSSVATTVRVVSRLTGSVAGRCRTRRISAPNRSSPVPPAASASRWSSRSRVTCSVRVPVAPDSCQADPARPAR